MQEVFRQIRERHRLHHHHHSTIEGAGGRGSRRRHHMNVNGKTRGPVQPLNLSVFLPSENLKTSSTIIHSSRVQSQNQRNNSLLSSSSASSSSAHRACLCDCSQSHRKAAVRSLNPATDPCKPLKELSVLPPDTMHAVALGVVREGEEEEIDADEQEDDSWSLAKRYEAKLKELLCISGKGLVINDFPNAYRMRGCFQVLEDLCQKKLPFSRVLCHVCDTLRCSLYCSSETSPNNEMETYFELVHRIEREIADMEAENASWQAGVLAQRTDLISARAELQELRDELAKAESASDDLKRRISSAVQVLNSEKEKVNGLHTKIKTIKSELKDIRKEVRCAQLAEAAKASEIEDYEKLKALYMQLVHEFQRTQAFLHSSQCEFAESAPKADLIAAKAEILELLDKISAVQAQISTFEAETCLLTPRPRWGGEIPGMDKPYELSTAQQVERVCNENTFLSGSISRLQIDFAALESAISSIMPLQERGKTDIGTVNKQIKQKPESAQKGPTNSREAG